MTVGSTNKPMDVCRGNAIHFWSHYIILRSQRIRLAILSPSRKKCFHVMMTYLVRSPSQKLFLRDHEITSTIRVHSDCEWLGIANRLCCIAVRCMIPFNFTLTRNDSGWNHIMFINNRRLPNYCLEVSLWFPSIIIPWSNLNAHLHHRPTIPSPSHTVKEHSNGRSNLAITTKQRLFHQDHKISCKLKTAGPKISHGLYGCT